MLINGAGNALPLHKTLDGYRLLRFLLLALRGNKPLACVPDGPCPACSAAVAAPHPSKGPALSSV
ncbi:hypothetical protein [Paenarthrobacter sp. C1]|uniref:hypothetical protein n=1 Tax=Paenarthrobacter sp. C1 TaxID=3400220 RepID=UPI003BF5422D